MKISARLKISSLISCGMLAVVVSLLVWSTGELQRAGHNDVLADDIQTRVFERVTLRDDYFLYSGERALQQWQAVTAKTGELLGRGARQFTGRDERRIAAELQAHFDESVGISRRLVGHAHRLDRTGGRQLHDDELGKRLYGQIMLKESELQEAAGRLQKLTRQRFNRATNRTLTITCMFVFLVVAVTAFNAAFVTRLLRRRLDALRTGAAVIAAGDLGHRIECAGSDELAELGAVLNGMAGRVQEFTEQLRKSHDLLDGLSRQVPGILFLARLFPDGRFSIPYASEAMHDIYELSPAEVRDDATPIFERFHPDDFAGLLASFRESADTLEPWEYEYRFVLPGSRVRWCHGIARPQRDDDGILWHGFISDITDRKLMQQALQDSEERLQMALEATHLGVWDWDLVTDRVIWSRECYEIVGFREFDGRFASFAPLLHPEDAGRVVAAVQQAIADRIPYADEFRIIRPDTGEVCWLANRGRVRYADDGTPLSVYGTVQDVTEHRQLEDALRQSEARYREVVEDQTEVITRFLPDGTYTFVNGVYCRLFGKTQEELIGSSWQPDAFPGDLSHIEEQLRHMSPANPVVVVENRVRTAAGEVRWMQFVNRGFYDEQGRLVETQAVGRDVTALKQAEMALKESTQRFYTVFHASPVGVGISRIDNGKFIDVNETFLELFGYTRPEVVGHTSLELGLWPDQAKREQMLDELRRQGRVRDFEAPFHHRSGRTGYLLLSVELIELAGQPHMMGMLTDITARKNAEIILAGMNEHLERQVVDRTASLTEANEKLVREIEERKRVEQELLDYHQKLESLSLELSLAEERERDRIAGELHDQVGQRLILGKMKLDALASMLPPDGPEREAMEIGEIIDLSIQDIRSLTFQIRPPILASAGLEAALRWLGEELRSTAGLEVEFTSDDSPKPLRYEVRATLFQAVRELMLNVVKHAGTGRCRVRSLRDGDRIVIVVEDDGSGFTSGQGDDRPVGEGGFGLFNVRQRIEYLGGSFSIEALATGGTRAVISVPLDIAAHGET